MQDLNKKPPHNRKGMKLLVVALFVINNLTLSDNMFDDAGTINKGKKMLHCMLHSMGRSLIENKHDICQVF